MSRKHTAALVALVATSKVTNFYPGLAPLVGGKPQAGPYAVFYSGEGTDTQPRFTSGSVRQNPSWTVHCVGSTADQASWVFEQIKGVLFPRGLGAIPAVDDESPGPFWFESPIDVQRDDDSTPPLFWNTIRCGFFSDLI
ncbi:hypothetical protein [Subtercola boreus]|uniref:hypothetical protein n=1 Tax=Subtercola boreus TaxID=120213 RepID=UPI0011C027C6|nr:hypothetical protein [Subtercola boreus]